MTQQWQEWTRWTTRILGGGALLAAATVCSMALEPSALKSTATPPLAGEAAPDFELAAHAGSQEGQVKLSESLKKGPVVLLVLRGYPGYQCPLCTRQVGSFLAKADRFRQLGATVLFVYPGPSGQLDQRAGEFLKGIELPAPFTLLLDPDYQFTNAYGLRWNAPRETAYPATFVIAADGKVSYALVSKTHGGRSDVDAVLKALATR
ncbi:peroxiredoxin family protein [Lignipirellula cremea]|uniref:thioredoxin-dependent peroxiredoxin n=1 Tax=Lignipirellula cremea TaxID=2528010 RepID=A0A518DNQ7_9BACT|nr:peroxiredoxin family protein [Lignipirellula cremea]QDU93470.1 AhpC/TSA family protein [Lignipirellula cremea]